MSFLPCFLLVVLLHSVFSACIGLSKNEELVDGFAASFEESDGTATFFNDFRETECFGSDHSRFPKGPQITALHHSFFTKSMCGRCLRVKCIHGHCRGNDNVNNNDNNNNDDDAGVVVMVADRCDGNCNGDLDLSLPAFSRIADPEQGIINVHYAWADCP